MLKVSIKESRGSELESNHYHTVRKKPNAKDLNKTEIHEFFWKSKVCNSRASKPTSDTISHYQEFSDLQDIKSSPSLEIWRVAIEQFFVII